MSTPRPAGSFCTVASGDTCQAGAISTIPGGFGELPYPKLAVNTDPASPSYGNIYTTDLFNFRVQELTPAGKFVLMFGKEVNETTHGNICTQHEIETEGVKCKAGVRASDTGEEPGAFEEPGGLAVDPTSGDVYVAEQVGDGAARVQEFTPGGQFVREIGKEVNETAHKNGETTNENLCPVKAGDICKGPALSNGSAEHGVFEGEASLAAGGPEDLLYVAEEHRVQEFNADGTWAHDLPLTSIPDEGQSKTIAVDQTNGDVYDRSQNRNVIYKFDASGTLIGEFTLSPREKSGEIHIEGMALDSSGRLAVVEKEIYTTTHGNERFAGLLLNGATGKLITEFPLLQGPPNPFSEDYENNVENLAFSAGDVNTDEQLYGASSRRREVVGYVPKVVAELVTGAVTCKEEAEQETSAAFDCELRGQVNPENVAKTETLFLWGVDNGLQGPETQETPRQDIATGETLAPAPAAVIHGVRPNEVVYSELAGYDEVNEAPEHALAGEQAATSLPLVAPKLVGQPSVSFVKSSSAVMFGELNPENARTEYFFEYGSPQALAGCPEGVRKETCPGVASTTTQESAAYERVGTTLEATDLQPASEYAYRLFAESESRDKSEKRESVGGGGQAGRFTTGPAPVPQASTGSPSAVTATGAVVSGSVNPEGQASTYAFELGVYEGALTRYGVVFSGSAGGGVPVEETLALAGLQPGTTYAYRIKTQNGYGETTGATATFTTAGLPAVIAVPTPLAMLAVPGIAFPVEAKASTVKSTKKAPAKCAKGKKRTHGRCVRAKAHKPVKKSSGRRK